MTLGNMRELGVQRLTASCLNDACRHTALIDVSSYPAETEVPYFRSKVVCAKCGRGEQDRRSAQLEGASAAGEPDREGLPLMARRRIEILRKRAERLGTIEAASEKEAVEKAAKEFDIPPERQNWIVVQKISAKD